MCAGLAVGLLWTGCYGLLFRTPSRQYADGEPREYTFVVADYPKSTSWGASVTVRLKLDGAFDPKAWLYAGRETLKYRPGDTFTARARLTPSDERRGEHIDTYQSAGIYLLGSVKGETTLADHPNAVPPRYWPQVAANTIKGVIRRSFPQDVEGFFIALLTGDKSELPDGLYAAFRRAGIAHIVAVSGLHIGYLAGTLAYFLGRRRKVTFALTVPVLLFYAAISGNSPSTLRAVLMFFLLSLAPLVNREDDPPTTLAAVLTLLLLICPYAAASISLQLSFAAIAGISLLSGPLSARWMERLPKRNGGWGKLLHQAEGFLVGTLAVTLGALLFSTPVAALHYRSISLVGVLTNLLTLWAASWAFLLGLVCALLGLVSPQLAVLPASVASLLARWVMWVAAGISKWPFAAVATPSGYLALWFVVAYAVVLLWVFSPQRIRTLFPVSAILLTLCAALLVNAWPAMVSQLTVAVLDVGQGASTLLYSKGHAILVDCGGNTMEDAGDIAADYIQSLGTSRLDALILTHYHTDHAGGVPELLSRLDVSLLILPDVTPEEPLRAEIISLAEQYGCDVELLYHDSHVAVGTVSLEIFEPLGSGGANEEGLSVLCTAGDFDVLITGDMNDVVERRLVRNKALPDIELLVAGHHGSRTSTSEELLLATTPEMAVISSGYNSYGHPAPEALERLGAAGCDIYRTDQMGTVTFTVKGG